MLWQSANRLQAKRVTIDRTAKTLVAEGSVVSQFLDKKPNPRTGRTVNTVVRAEKLPLARALDVDAADAALAARLRAFAEKAEAVRRQIVATKEGGAITGEERLREHAEILYAALNGWEGRPARYQLERIDALERELRDVERELAALFAREVPPLDGALRGRKLAPIPTAAPPPPRGEASSAGLRTGFAAFLGE